MGTSRFCAVSIGWSAQRPGSGRFHIIKSLARAHRVWARTSSNCPTFWLRQSDGSTFPNVLTVFSGSVSLSEQRKSKQSSTTNTTQSTANNEAHYHKAVALSFKREALKSYRLPWRSWSTIWRVTSNLAGTHAIFKTWHAVAVCWDFLHQSTKIRKCFWTLRWLCGLEIA